MPYISVEYTERMIRDYIEGKRTEEYVDHEFCETYFECAWVVIKAEVDARKARNERARLKRVARRDAILAEAARLKAIEDERIARAEAARKAEAEAAEAARKERARKRRERNIDRTNCITRQRKPAATRNLSSCAVPTAMQPSTSTPPSIAIPPSFSKHPSIAPQPKGGVQRLITMIRPAYEVQSPESQRRDVPPVHPCP